MMLFPSFHAACRIVLFIMFIAGSVPCSDAIAQEGRSRIILNIGTGLGWNPAARVGGHSHDLALDVGFKIGLSQHIAAGFEWVYRDALLPSDATDRNSGPVLTVFPRGTGLYAKAGVGFAHATLSSDQLDVVNRREGWGTMLGLGAELMRMSRLAVTADAIWVYQRFNSLADFPTENQFLLLTVGLAWRIGRSSRSAESCSVQSAFWCRE